MSGLKALLFYRRAGGIAYFSYYENKSKKISNYEKNIANPLTLV